MTELIRERIGAWDTLGYRQELFQNAKGRSCQVRQKETSRVALWAKEKRKGTVEKAVVRALRIGDVSKALRLLCSAPLADKGPETVAALRELHPVGARPEPVAPCPSPHWTAETVGPALSPSSAAGLFGYTPFHLQQCYGEESWSFSGALIRAVNQLSNGDAPTFLKPFLAGGVSIALQKKGTGSPAVLWRPSPPASCEVLLFRGQV